MIKRDRKKLVANQQAAKTNSTRGMKQSAPAKNVGVLSSEVQTIKQPSKAPSNCLNQIESLQTNPIRLMQHQEESPPLGQQINNIILNSSDAQSVLRQIAQVLGLAFAVDSCAIVIIHEQGQQSIEQIGYWSDEDVFKIVPPSQQKSGVEALASLLQADFESLAIADVQAPAKTSNLRQWQELSLPLRAILKIPTYFQGKPNGVIALGRLQPYYWSDSEQESARTAAESVAIAILQIVQTQTIASLERYVDNSTQYQNAIDRLIMASRTSSDLNHILQLAISGTAQALQVERGLIITIRYSDPVFRHRPTQTIPKAKVTVISEWLNNGLGASTEDIINSPISANSSNFSIVNQSFWLSECSLCQQALTTSAPPLIINGAADLGEIDPQTDIAPIFHFSNFPNVLMFPLESQNTVFGFIVLQQTNSRLWQAEDLSLLELVSAQVSTSIIQNQTLRQVQSLVEERTAQLQRSLDVQSKLFEKTRQQIDQLRQLNQLKDEFINTISHELRTPLTSMNLAIRMLRQPGIPAERQQKYLDILEEQCTQEINLINDLLTLQKLEAHQAPLNLQTIQINTKLNELAQMFAEQWLEKEVDITVDLPENLLSLQTDSDSFDRILHELLNNAGKYADPDTNAILKASQHNSQIIISITNIGPAISSEDASYIFDKFRRGQGVTDRAIKGTGLGLALVKSLVQHLNGTIEVVSTPMENSSSAQVCFTLTLPQLSAST